ncbi:hypothetical protein E2C01_077832 [Portunus trituberculatus]|uniref:Uncharacterized protein n=1 Tax=Portunus trituberculatus TaxID=210409 RepID=A0A5B7IMD5_PORTR|nr:hypothetical protein [Portunus trituberculatus]
MQWKDSGGLTTGQTMLGGGVWARQEGVTHARAGLWQGALVTSWRCRVVGRRYLDCGKGGGRVVPGLCCVIGTMLSVIVLTCVLDVVVVMVLVVS